MVIWLLLYAGCDKEQMGCPVPVDVIEWQLSQDEQR